MTGATTAADALLRPLGHFAGAREPAAPGERLERVRQAARRLRAEMLDAPAVPYYRSFDLIRVPYPTRYALRDACALPTPFVHILNRMFVVQYHSAEGLKTLLASPTDHEGARETPFFKRMSRRFGPLRPVLEPLMAPQYGTVQSCLAETGLRPSDVDYITYDHLHTQDLRRWLGTGTEPGYFPRARLLVMRQEWESARALLPPQRDWYCPGGLEGVPPERVVLLDGDVLLGEGVALVRTPGHTEGNHSIAVRTPEGVLVTSENGVSADCYAPESSRLPGLRRYARDTGMEVVLNGNTMEGGLDQYISMVLEKELAGPSTRDPRFPSCVPSSELTPYWLFPGIRPSLRYGPLRFGQVARPSA
jgi:hypothetical protein